MRVRFAHPLAFLVRLLMKNVRRAQVLATNNLSDSTDLQQNRFTNR